MTLRARGAVAVVAVGLALAGCTAQVEPPPPIAPTAPAPMPAGIGADGETGRVVAPPQVTPDAGTPVELIDPDPADGVGGEAWMTSPIWGGRAVVTAGQWYPSGRFHGGLDIGLLWTELRAPRDARVIGMNDGAPNHPSGSAYAIPGSASNWIMLCARVEGREATLYLQHLSPGVRVHAGQSVKAGTVLARSGNTGFSTGPHLHLSAQWLRKGQTCAGLTSSAAAAQRYDYLTADSLRVFSPARWWAQPAPKIITLGKSRKIAWVAHRFGVKPWRLCKRNPTIKRCGPERRLRAGRIVRVS